MYICIIIAYMNKEDLALNNPQGLISHKTQRNEQIILNYEESNISLPLHLSLFIFLSNIYIYIYIRGRDEKL